MPPDEPIIYEAKRREKAKNVELYNEGSDILLVCEVTGGKYNFKFNKTIKNLPPICRLQKISCFLGDF